LENKRSNLTFLLRDEERFRTGSFKKNFPPEIYFQPQQKIETKTTFSFVGVKSTSVSQLFSPLFPIVVVTFLAKTFFSS